MKSIIIGLLALCCASLAVAESSHQFTQRLKMEALAYRTMSALSLCALQNTAASQRQLDGILQLGSGYSKELAEDWPEISREWQLTEQFIARHRSEEALQEAAFSAVLQTRMETLYATFELSDSAEQTALIDANLKTRLDLLLSLDKMLSGYLFFNANIFGGLSSVDTHIEKESVAFDQNLAKLDDAQLRAELGRKWNFIKDTLLAYNERSAVFVVDRTGSSMRKLLLESVN